MYTSPDMLGNIAMFSVLLLGMLDPFGWFDKSDDAPAQNADDTDAAETQRTVLTEGNDEHIAGPGDDIIFGLGGNDMVQGGAGNDFIEGNTGNDVILGQAGNDLIAGGAGTDSLYGGDGNDVISSDRLDANADFSRGEADQLSGGGGDDRLIFSSGDIVRGGAGVDQFDVVVIEGQTPATIEDFDATKETLTAYYTPANAGDPAPEATFTQDQDAGTTSVLLGGTEVVRVTGLVSFTDQNFAVAEASTLTFPTLPSAET